MNGHDAALLIVAGMQTDPLTRAIQTDLGAVRLGDLVRGRVLERHGEGRFLIDFSGDRQVVDSTIPLAVDDILYGRVVALGERMEIRRVRIEPAGTRAAAAVAAESPAAQAQMLSRLADLIERMGQRRDAVGAAPAGDAARLDLGRAAAMLARLGIQPTLELSAAIEEALDRAPEDAAFTPASPPIVLAADRHAGSSGAAPWITALAALLSESMATFLTAADSASARLFNVQDDSALAHAAMTLPFSVDERRVNVNVALFEQRPSATSAAGQRYRSLVLSLDLDALGPLEVRAVITGKRAAVRFVCATERAAHELSRHVKALRHACAEVGWSVDTVRYDLAKPTVSAPIPQAIFEHVAYGRQQSFNG